MNQQHGGGLIEMNILRQNPQLLMIDFGKDLSLEDYQEIKRFIKEKFEEKYKGIEYLEFTEVYEP